MHHAGGPCVESSTREIVTRYTSKAPWLHSSSPRLASHCCKNDSGCGSCCDAGCSLRPSESEESELELRSVSSILAAQGLDKDSAEPKLLLSHHLGNMWTSCGRYPDSIPQVICTSSWTSSVRLLGAIRSSSGRRSGRHLGAIWPSSGRHPHTIPQVICTSSWQSSVRHPDAIGASSGRCP